MSTKKRTTRHILVGVIIAAVAVTGVGVAFAHHGKDGSEWADCYSVGASFVDFGTSQPSWNILIESESGSITKSFNGDNGQVQAEWTELGVDIQDGQTYKYRFSWTTPHGGGKFPSGGGWFEWTSEDCNPEPPDTTVPPPDTTIPPICADGCEPPPCYDPLCDPPPGPIVPPPPPTGPIHPGGPVKAEPVYTG